MDKSLIFSKIKKLGLKHCCDKYVISCNFFKKINVINRGKKLNIKRINHMLAKMAKG